MNRSDQEFRKLQDVDDEEFLEAAKSAISFPELKLILGLSPIFHNEQIVNRAKKLYCAEVFDNYQKG